MIKGIIHIHSIYSTDADYSIAELKNLFIGFGYDFIAVTDHLDSSDDDNERKKIYLSIIDECRENTDDRFCIIPGLEIATTEGYHILGVGLKSFVTNDSVNIVIKEIQKQGALAILAHPYRDSYEKFNKDFFCSLNGIEIWNRNEFFGKYPNKQALRDVLNLRKSNFPVFGYIASDFHVLDCYARGALVINSQQIHQDMIMQKLKAGEFEIQVDKVEIGNQGKISRLFSIKCSIHNFLYFRVRNSLKRFQKKLETWGIKIPRVLLVAGKLLFFRKRKIWSG